MIITKIVYFCWLLCTRQYFVGVAAENCNFLFIISKKNLLSLFMERQDYLFCGYSQVATCKDTYLLTIFDH